ncbi:MAG: sugar phosphate isomerase/epimerase [Blautia sp.]|nr:sugar phosphate isomerase/epimerase [Blautia sp.]
MRLGGFGKIEDYDKIKAAGFDYAELDMPEIEALSEEELSRFAAHVEECGFPVPTGARIIPVTDPLFFIEGFQNKDWEEYLKSSCRKNARLGIKKILFGGGKARSLQGEESRRLEGQFISFMRMLCEIAGEHGQEILIEPLGPKYSNYMNTVPAALEVAEKISMPNLFVMADLRHFIWSGEPLEDIGRYQESIHHYHMDFPLSFPERGVPSVEDGYNYASYLTQLALLKDQDYTLTIESDIPKDWMAAGRQVREVLKYYGPEKA